MCIGCLFNPSITSVHVGETEGDPDSILRTLEDPSSWFNVSSDDSSRPVWLEVLFPPHMRVVELTKYTFSHGMNMASHMFPYGISDSSWFQLKVRHCDMYCTVCMYVLYVVPCLSTLCCTSQLRRGTHFLARLSEPYCRTQPKGGEVGCIRGDWSVNS